MKKILIEQMTLVKRKLCDRIIVLLAKLIRACSKKEAFIQHLESIDEDRKNSDKFKKIDSKKEELFAAILNLRKYNSELLTAFEMIDKLLENDDFEKAKEICKVVKNDINKKD